VTSKTTLLKSLFRFDNIPALYALMAVDLGPTCRRGVCVSRYSADLLKSAFLHLGLSRVRVLRDMMAGPHPPHLESILTDPALETGSPSRPGKRQRRQSPRAKASYPRKRANQACRTCRVRRTKCDNERPSCSSCTAMSIPCIYQSGDPST
jgi:Fungal Zn(2)-Cys(6) binuclear cluster domain